MMKSTFKAIIFLMIIFVILAGCSNPTGSQQKSTSEQSTPVQSPLKGLTYGRINPGTGYDGDGYYYSYWASNGGSGITVNMTGDHGYNTTCNNLNGGFVAGKGWSTGTSSRFFFYVCFDFYSSYGGAFGLYGWTQSPLIEYYICDQTGAVQGPHNSSEEKNGNGHYLVGSVTSWGSTYDIYSHFRDGFPSIEGDTTQFWQYISKNRTARMYGMINMQDHINAWANCWKNPYNHNLGKMTIGYHNYQILFTEMWSPQDVNGNPLSGQYVNGSSNAYLEIY